MEPASVQQNFRRFKSSNTNRSNFGNISYDKKNRKQWRTLDFRFSQRYCWGLVSVGMRRFENGWLLTYLLHGAESWEANCFAASQEIPRISQNPKVHYRTYKRPPAFSFLGQPNPFHIPISHLQEIHPNIIHPSTPRSPQLSPSLRFPHQDPINPLSLTH